MKNVSISCTALQYSFVLSSGVKNFSIG